MTDYWVSFRINEDAGYDRRYANFTEMISEVSERKYWDDTTSFYLVDTPLDIDTLTRTLAKMLSNKDILLIRVLDTQDARYFGAVEREDALTAFMSYARRVL